MPQSKKRYLLIQSQIYITKLTAYPEASASGGKEKMETKYNIDDEVLIKARIRRIAVREDGSIEYAVQGNSAEYMIYKEKDIIGRYGNE